MKRNYIMQYYMGLNFIGQPQGANDDREEQERSDNQNRALTAYNKFFALLNRNLLGMAHTHAHRMGWENAEINDLLRFWYDSINHSIDEEARELALDELDD